MCHSSFCLRDFVFGSSTAEKGVCAWCLPLLLNYQLWLWLVSLTYISQTLHGTAIYAYIGVVVWGVNVAAYMAVPWSVWVYTKTHTFDSIPDRPDRAPSTCSGARARPAASSISPRSSARRSVKHGHDGRPVRFRPTRGVPTPESKKKKRFIDAKPLVVTGFSGF